jgi:hypothetical protein
MPHAMAQNIYDNEEFFAGYSRLLRSVEGLEGAPEWRALRAMLPDVRARRVLDFGCGFGWFCRWARMSPRTCWLVPEPPPDPAIVYIKSDMKRLALPVASFDLVYSSLAAKHETRVSRGCERRAQLELFPNMELGTAPRRRR